MRRPRGLVAAGLLLGLAMGPAAAQIGPPAPPPPDPGSPAPTPYRGGVLPPPRGVVPDHAFAPLRPEPGDIWSEVRGWSSPEARRHATGQGAVSGSDPAPAAGRQAGTARAVVDPATPQGSRAAGRTGRREAEAVEAPAEPVAPGRRPRGGRPGAAEHAAGAAAPVSPTVPAAPAAAAPTSAESAGAAAAPAGRRRAEASAARVGGGGQAPADRVEKVRPDKARADKPGAAAQ